MQGRETEHTESVVEKAGQDAALEGSDRVGLSLTHRENDR
jgi:hypothetical protein